MEGGLLLIVSSIINIVLKIALFVALFYLITYLLRNDEMKFLRFP